MPDAKQLVGPNVIIMAPSGTGKTFSLGTLVDWAERNGKEVFVLFTEPGLETLLGYWKDEIKDEKGNIIRETREIPECLHWHQHSIAPLSLKSLMTGADLVGKSTYEMLTKMQDSNRSGDNNSFYKLLASCSDFTDDRTGKKFGPIDAFGIDKIFAIDSLTELSVAALKMQVGVKPMAAPQDYGVAQQYIIGFIRLCTQGIPCTFVMTAHVDRILDTVTQEAKIMVKSAGKALADEIPTLFSDVIYAVREGDRFFWDTAKFGVDTKTRSLGYKSKLPPDFATIMDVWKKRAGI